MKHFLTLLLISITTFSIAQTKDEYAALAQEKYEVKDYNGAINVIDEAEEKGLADSYMIGNRGGYKRALGNFKAALKDYQTALSQTQYGGFPFVIRIGECLVKAGKNEDALKYFDEKIKDTQAYKDMLVYKALALLNTGKSEEGCGILNDLQSAQYYFKTSSDDRAEYVNAYCK